MSEVVGEAVIRITTDESGVDVDGAGKRAGAGYSKGFGSSLKGIGLAIGGALAAAGTVDFLKDSVAEAREAQKVGAATESIIKATGSAAKITTGQIGDLASALSAKTGIDDEQIQAGANLLLTFKNVKREGEGLNDVFGRATAAGLDLAAAGFGSVEGNAKQLGKALNDPLKGITALGRAGVTFTAAQQEQIKGYVASNDLLSAQKIILGEVEAQVGGTAEATATSGEKAAIAFGNIKESVGTALLPVLDTLADVFVTKIAPAIQDVLAGGGQLAPVFAAIGAVIGSVFGGGQGAAVSSFFDSILASVQTLIPVFQETFMGTILPAITSLVGYLQANLVPIFIQVVQIITGTVVPAVVALATFIYGTLYPALVTIVAQVAERLKPVFDTLFEVIQTQILPAFQSMVEQIRTQLVPALEPIIVKVIAIVGFLANLAATILGVVLPPLIKFQVFLLTHILPVLIDIITFVVRVIGVLLDLGAGVGRAGAAFGRFVSDIASAVSKAVSSVVDGIGGLPDKILGFVGKMLGAGKDLIGGLLEGMRSAATGVGGIVSSVATAVLGAVKTAVNSVIDLFNSAIPDSLGAGPLKVDLPNNPIPHLQAGVRSFAGGYATVGEVGPERVFLPQGARVLTAAQTRQADTGGIDYAQLAAVVVAAVKAMRPINLSVPTEDPYAVAMMVANRLAVD